jgi:hypothetical protein
VIPNNSKLVSNAEQSPSGEVTISSSEEELPSASVVVVTQTHSVSLLQLEKNNAEDATTASTKVLAIFIVNEIKVIKIQMV